MDMILEHIPNEHKPPAMEGQEGLLAMGMARSAWTALPLSGR